jgi:hypothetical protein
VAPPIYLSHTAAIKLPGLSTGKLPLPFVDALPLLSEDPPRFFRDSPLFTSLAPWNMPDRLRSKKENPYLVEKYNKHRSMTFL